MPRTKKPCAVSKGRAHTSSATIAERLAAIEAVTSRLGRGNSLGHRILRARLAVAAFLQVENRFWSDYDRELKEAVREGRSGIRNGILYEREILVMNDAEAAKEGKLVLAIAEEVYERAHASPINAPAVEETATPTPAKGRRAIKGAEVFASASPVLEELEHIAGPGVMTRSMSLEGSPRKTVAVASQQQAPSREKRGESEAASVSASAATTPRKGKGGKAKAALAPAPSAAVIGGALSPGRAGEETTTRRATKTRGVAAVTPPTATTKGNLPAPMVRAPPMGKGVGATTVAAALLAETTAVAVERPKQKKEPAPTMPTFVLRVAVRPASTFKDGRNVVELPINRGETVMTLRQRMKTIVNKDQRGNRLLSPRGINHFIVTEVRNGRDEKMPNKAKLEHDDVLSFTIANAVPRKTPLKKRGEAAVVAEGGPHDGDDGDNAEGGGGHIGFDAPLAGAHAGGPLQGPVPLHPRIPEKECAKMFRAAMERIAKWMGYVKERTGRTRKSSENPLELFNIFIDIEKTIPPREEKPVNDANYGTEDTTDINGVFDEARITDVFRGGPDSVHRGLGAVYTKADDPNVLQSGILAALEGRKPERALDLARNGVKPKPTVLTKERLRKYLPSRDATRDENPETKIPTLPEEMRGGPTLDIAFETIKEYLAAKSEATARGCNGPMWKQLKDLVCDEEGGELLHSIVQALAQETLQMKFTPDEETLVKQGAGIAIDKDDGGLRPIGIVNTLFSLSHAVMQRTLMANDHLMSLCTPNLGLGVPGAADLLPRVATEALRVDIENILASMDVESAFPSLEHDCLLHSVIGAAQGKPALYVLARHAFNMYTGIAFTLNFACPVSTVKFTHEVSRGTIQGSITGVLLFIIAVNKLLEGFRAEFPPSSLMLGALSDDHSMVGKLPTIIAAFPKMVTALARGGLHIKSLKTHFSGAPLADPAVRARITAATGYSFPAEYVREKHDVMKLAGIPVGHPTPVKRALALKIDNLIKSIRVLLDAATSTDKKDKYAIMQTIYLLRTCIIPAATHYTRGMEPAVSKPEVARLDAEIIRAVFSIVRLETLLQGTPENGDLARFLASPPQRNETGGYVGMETLAPSVIDSIIRINLPSNMGGLGMQPLARLADANYLASIQLTAHALPSLCPQLIHFVGTDGLALPAQEPFIGPVQRDDVIRIPQFRPEVMQSADQARGRIAALFEGDGATQEYLRKEVIESVRVELRTLSDLNVYDVPPNAKRGTTSAISRVTHHANYLQLYHGLSEEGRIAIKSSSGTAASGWQRARPLHKRGVLSNGIIDNDYSWSLKYLLGMPFAIDAAAPGKAEAPLPCVVCGRALTMEHALSCTTKKGGVAIHNANVHVIAALMKQANHDEPVRVGTEQPIAASYPTAKPNYADPERPPYQDLRSDVGTFYLDGSGASFTVDMKVNAPAAYKFRPTDPNYSAPVVSDAAAKALLEANSGLAPVPTSARLQNWLPGTGPYVEHKITTSGFIGEADKVSLYGKRSEGIKFENFYAVVIDTHGAVGPRGRHLIQKLAKMAAANAVSRRAAVRPWWQIAEATTIELSATTQRGVAMRLQQAYTECKREALSHSNPTGALGAPKTKFSTIQQKTEKRSLVPGATWKTRDVPLKPVKKRGPNTTTTANAAAGAAAVDGAPQVGGP